MLLAATMVPQGVAAITKAAAVTGLSVADVKTRLAGILPRVLLVDPDAERARAIAVALEGLGFGIILCDPRLVPRDEDRFVARKIAWGQGPSGSFTVVDEAGELEEIGARSLILVQRGVRTTATTQVTKQATRQLDLTRALLTGGLLLTKKVETTSVRTTTAREGFLLLHRAHGDRDVIIYERRMDYRGVAANIATSSAANFALLTTRLRAALPGVPHDDRTGRPGFVSGMLASPAAATDLAVWLVLLAHLRGAPF